MSRRQTRPKADRAASEAAPSDKGPAKVPAKIPAKTPAKTSTGKASPVVTPPAPEQTRLAVPAADDFAEAFARAARAIEARQFGEAETLLRELRPKAEGLARFHGLYGQALRNLGRADEAWDHVQTALALEPDNLLNGIYRGLIEIDRRDFTAAKATFETIVRRAPENSEHHRLLGLASKFTGDFTRAAEELQRAIDLAPKNIAIYRDLAALRDEQDQPAEAMATLDRGLAAIGPHRSLVESKIALLRRRGRHREAALWIESLIGANPPVGWLHYQLGLTLQSSDRNAANAQFARARELAPADMDFLVAHAESLNRTRSPNEAESLAEAYRLAQLRLEQPEKLAADARPLIGIFLRCADFDAIDKLGDFESLGRRFAAAGAETALHLMLSQVRAPEHRRLLIDWHRQCGENLVRAARASPLAPPASPPTVGRAKIRIGLMSSDLRDHPVGYFARPLVGRYDRSRFEVFGYSWYPRDADPLQRWFASRMDGFRCEPRIGMRDAAQLIANDRLDILFDLGGSTDLNKLAVLAWKPAPRVASWLAYPHSAGLSTIDRILVDPYLQPEDPALLLEKPFRLASSWVAFERPDLEPLLPIHPATPQERRGFVTFGTMNNPMKFNRELFAAWAQVMTRTPGSRFLFVRPEAAVAAFRDRVAAHFEANGVSRDRIVFAPVRGAHLAYYDQIDVALDAFPQTGGTTTCETLWMGVPAIALTGEAMFERLSYSNLANAGLPELSAPSVAAYVAKAVEVARDTAWRTGLRRTMRERLRAHPLGDGRAFTRDFENAATAWLDERAA